MNENSGQNYPKAQNNLKIIVWKYPKFIKMYWACLLSKLSLEMSCHEWQPVEVKENGNNYHMQNIL